MLLLSSCSVLTETGSEKRAHNLTIEQKREIEQFISTWEITFQSDMLMETIAQEYARWQHPKASIPFVISQIKEDGQEHIGLFQSSNNWEIKGRSKVGHTFKLENNKGKITLSHGGEQLTYNQKNFYFLLPVQHLELIQHILFERKYDYLSWSESEQGWYVEFRSSSQPLEQMFYDYIHEHVALEQEEIDYQFNGFSIWYRLQLRELEDRLVLKSIQFSLIKNEEWLDTLLFIF